MKKRIASLFALALLLAPFASCASASGNATIAVMGRDDGFDDFVASMFVWDDRLLLSTYDAMFTWSEEEGLAKLPGGREELNRLIEPVDEDGTRVVRLGDVEIELDAGESFYYYYDDFYSAGDRLYRTAVVSGEDGVQSVYLVEITLDEDGHFAPGGVLNLSDEMIEDYGGYYGARSLDQCCGLDGKLYGLYWADDGMRTLAAIDLEEGAVESLPLEAEGEITGLSAFGDGKLLLSLYTYEEGENASSISLYDVESGETTSLGSLPQGNGLPTALCFDEARSRLYYVQDGYVWRTEVSESGIGEAEAFGDMPLEIYMDARPVMLGDLYILSSYDGVVGRDVTVEQLPEKTLTVVDAGYSRSTRRAYFDFIVAHPEFAVAFSNRGINAEEIIQAMMTRESDIDIFTMETVEPAYASLKERGYLADLSGSEKLTALVDGIYPAFADAVRADGALYALPMKLYVSQMQINVTLLTEKLGFTREDIPSSWPGLFALLAELSDGRMQEVPEASILSPGYTRSDAQLDFLYAMMNDYMLWLDADEAHLERGSEVLTAMLEAYERIDWEGFGLPEEFEDGMFEYHEENMLFRTASVTPSGLGDRLLESDPEWRLLDLPVAEGEDPMIGAELTVAFVNPYSEHVGEAVEYLEDVAALIDEDMLVALCPDRNDPIENTEFAEGVKNYDDAVADAQEALAKAEEQEDDEQIALLTERLENIRESREWYERHARWLVSAEGIEAYRAIAGKIVPSYSMVGFGDSDVFSVLQQYRDGAIPAEQLVAELAKTLQMQRLEDL